jgi:uncharacterized FlaG/YvyC family protein
MATIENLGAALSVRIVQQHAAREATLQKKRDSDKRVDNIPTTKRAAEIRASEEAQVSRESSTKRGRAIENKKEQTKRMSLEEFAEMLRKVNLTFDMFEIQARFIIDRESGDISIEVINQRTGEVIRKIPPYRLPDLVEAVKTGGAAVTDVMA